MKTRLRQGVMVPAMALCACLLPSACTMHASKPALAATPRGDARDVQGVYRFEMSQHGKRMSADEFDAWMKANGIRVAKGKPGAGRKTAMTSAKPVFAKARNGGKAVAKTGAVRQSAASEDD